MALLTYIVRRGMQLDDILHGNAYTKSNKSIVFQRQRMVDIYLST